MKSKIDPWRNFYWHSILLSSLAFSHPIFATLQQQPEFLLAHDLQGMNLLIWILAVALAVGLLFNVLVYALAKLVPAFESPIKISAVFLLFGSLVFVQLNRLLTLGFEVQLTLALATAALLTYFYARSVFLKSFLTAATFLILVTPIVFALNPNVRQIALPQAINLGGESGAAANKHPVVLLILDELSTPSLLDTEGQVNAHRYPNLAEFAKQATWYKYATTGAEATLLAVPPILTGRHIEPGTEKLPLATNYPENLFTFLQRTHRVNAFETFTQLCPESLCNTPEPDWEIILEDTLVVFAHIATPNAFKQDLPRIDKKWAGFMRDNEDQPNAHTDQDIHPHHRYRVRLEKLGRFLQELESISHTSLNYLHILMPHSPWMYLPDGRIYSNAERRSFTGIQPSSAKGLKYNKQSFSQQHVMDFVEQRYLLQLGYTDRLLGDVFSTLQNRGMFNDAMIIVMADHGISFKPGESQREATQNNVSDIMSIPLFIKFPGQDKHVTDIQPARAVDVLPTILHSLGFTGSHDRFDGIPLQVSSRDNSGEMHLLRDTGESRVIPYGELRRSFDETVASRRDGFANGTFEELYAVNGAGLVNRAPAELPMGERMDYSLRLDSAHLYEDYREEIGTPPALIRANRETAAEPGEGATVAVAVNGIVRAVSRLERIENIPFDYQVIVPPGSFKEGANVIEFFEVMEDAGKNRLHPITLEGSSRAGIGSADNGQLILSVESDRLPVGQLGTAGLVRLVADPNNRQIRLTGWSAHPESGLAASEIFFFADDRMIASVKPSLDSEEAQESTGQESARYSGFNVSVPMDDKTRAQRERFRAVALFVDANGATAGELRYENLAGAPYITKGIPGKSQMLESANEKGPIELDREYDFTDDAQTQMVAGFGWSRVGGSKGRWNTSHEAELSFNVENRSQPLIIKMVATPYFVEDLHEQQVVEAILPSGAKQVFQFRRGKSKRTFEIKVPRHEIAEDGSVDVLLVFPDSVSPESLGVNSDKRLLALYVRTVEVRVER